MGGLEGTKSNWKVSVSKLISASQNMIGDSLLCGGIITYLGIFPQIMREATKEKWSKFLEAEKISF